MITTKRQGSEIFSSATARGGLAVLERTESFDSAPTRDRESMREAKERMQRNLDKIMHPEKYQDEVVEEKVSETMPENIEEVAANNVVSEREDIMPSPTTMQFGDPSIDIKTEMKTEEERAVQGISKKGKIMVVLYSVAVALVLALLVN